MNDDHGSLLQLICPACATFPGHQPWCTVVDEAARAVIVDVLEQMDVGNLDALARAIIGALDENGFRIRKEE